MSATIICAIVGENQDELEFGYDEDSYVCAKMKLRLVCAIQRMCEKGVRTFVSTLDQGAAMWGAEACDAIKSFGGNVKLIAAPVSDGQADRWHPERRERYFHLLEAADEVAETDEEYSGEEYILRCATHLIVLCDNMSERIKVTVDRAKKEGITVYLV